ncbi:MAG: hypothetical protein KatS3mg035_0585 [Bacteroidia bacterium]|nr:MAG: hypothetical protein KatS3mg035_0585 [Bacteroidia bacterium]
MYFSVYNVTNLCSFTLLSKKKFQRKYCMVLKYIFKYSFFSLFIAILIFYNFNSCNKYKDYQNLAAEIQYVGKENCKKCHEDIYHEFEKSGMGHSFYAPGRQPWIENFENVIVFDKYSHLYYKPFLFQNHLYIQEYRLKDNNKDTLFSHLWKIDWIVGSGRQTRSYIVEKNGFLYEAPITWYTNKKIWDLSPGYHEGQNSGFRRPLGEECIHCHNGYSPFSEGTINHFQTIAQSIDCERCHGPGEIHSQNMEKDLVVDVGKGEIDYSIVNPKHLSIDKQLDICQQCHLQGIVVTQKGKRFQDYRPGLNIAQFFDVFTVENPNNQAFGIASHAERLKKSACFQKSTMTCTTCHNPHQPTDLSLAIQACLKCHSEPHQKKCSLKREDKSQKNCVQCHLHQSGTSDIPHVQFTDHFIRILNEKNKVLSPQNIQAIQLFCQTQSYPSKEHQAKAYWNYFETRNSHPIYLDTIQRIGFQEASLEAAKFYIYQKQWDKALTIIKKFQAINLQEKVWYNILLAEVYENQKDYQKAIAHYDKAYELQPFQVQAKLKSILLTLKNSDGSLKTLESAAYSLTEIYKKNPLDYFILLNLGKVYNDLRKYQDTEKYLLEALKVYPNGLEALWELEKLYQRNRDFVNAQKIRERIYITEKIKDKIQ